MSICRSRFDMNINNTKIFPTVTPCPEQQPLRYIRYDVNGAERGDNDPYDAAGNEEPIQEEGKWLIDGKNFHLIGGPSSQTFLRRYVRKICPTTLRQFVVGKWVAPPKPIFRDIGMPMKKGPLFANTNNKISKSQQYAKYATGRYKR